MKLKTILFFFFMSLKLVAQPGLDIRLLQMKRFEELTEKLKENPDNYELIWERIALTSFDNTYFDIYKKSGNLESNFSYFKNATNLINGLDKLIDNNIVIDNHNVVEFKLLRGRAYYFSGEIDKALKDYLSALNYNASLHNFALNDKIYISIAAYYYNLADSLTEENAKQALKYINMVNPNSCHSNVMPDCYEQEKKELLSFLKEEEKLITYYKKLILTEYNRYIEIKNYKFVTTNFISGKNRYYFGTLNRINDLAEFYNEIKDCKKSRNLIEQVVKYLPPDSNGQMYKTFPKEKLYGIKSEEYRKRFNNLHYKNKYKEIYWDYQDMSHLIESIKYY